MERFRIHFGVSQEDNPVYAKALDTAVLADEFGIRTRTGGTSTTLATTPLEEIQNGWYIATFTEEQIDLLAFYYLLSWDLPQPTLYGVSLPILHKYCLADANDDLIPDSIIRSAIREIRRSKAPMYSHVKDFFEARFLLPVQKDIAKNTKILYERGYLASPVLSQDAFPGRGQNSPRDYFVLFENLKKLARENRYNEFIEKYYEMLDKTNYGYLHDELIYIKRLAGIPFQGRDLLYFRRGKSQTELIKSYLSEYRDCIDLSIKKRKELGLQAPLDALIEYSPTLDQIIEEKKNRYVRGVYIWNNPPQKVTFSPEIFRYSPYTIKGNFIEYYIDQVRSCKVIENVPDMRFFRVWITYSPTSYQREILDKSLELHGIEIYRHEKWRQSKREPDFTTLTSLVNVKRSDCVTNGIRYTGRHHIINGLEFFEVDLLRNNPDKARVLGNTFRELVGEILRDAENMLRENHGLPRIGEGWVSEMELFNLVKSIFPDAKHHARPDWLKPQHLDVYIEAQKIAFEYQGRQHYEPIDYFGGINAYQDTKNRDEWKHIKCESNGINLIYWMYTEDITEQMLQKKLSSVKKSDKTPR